MATSGNYVYSVNKQELIKDALLEAGVLNDTQEPEGNMYGFMSRRLNGIIKQLQTKGLQLWRIKEVTLLLEEDKVEYTLGPSGDRCSETVIRALSTASVAIAATTYDVPSTGMTVGDVVGIEMSDGEMHWTTIATIPDTASITVTTGPTVACDSRAVVYSYTALIPKPLRIHEAYSIVKDSENNHIPLNIIPREEYMRLNSKNTEGYVNSLYFNPDRVDSKLKIWPVSSDNIQRIVMTAQLPFQTMDDAADELHFPDWWYEALHLTLSHAAARGYMAPIEKTRELRNDSLIAVQDAEDFDVETTYIEMVPSVKWIT